VSLVGSRTDRRGKIGVEVRPCVAQGVYSAVVEGLGREDGDETTTSFGDDGGGGGRQDGGSRYC
jgi:hypothetical protein